MKNLPPQKIKEQLEYKHSCRPTWAEINITNLKFNLDQVRKKTGPGVKIMAVVKANAYGHGIVEVSRAFISCGVDYLGVATLDESIWLRQAGIDIPILNLGSILEPETEQSVKWKITQTVTSVETVKQINKYAGDINVTAKVHLKVDTGMHRLGVRSDEVLGIVKGLKQLKNVELEGVYTHFPVAPRMDRKSRKFTLDQIGIFNKIKEYLTTLDADIKLFHCANSAAVMSLKQAHFNLVRPGIMLYGISPSVAITEKVRLKLKPVLSLKTRITHIRTVSAKEGVGYDLAYITPQETRIAVLPIGYADGYTRLYSNRARVLVRGQFAPVTGIICMDQCMIDVGHIKKVKVGDEVVLLGSQGREIVSAWELAGLSQTIPYEVLCRISSRVPRYFVI